MIKNKKILDIESNRKFKVLVFRNRDIGNTIMAEPFFRIIKDFFPNSEVHAVFDTIGKELMKNNPYIDKAYVFNRHKDSLSKQMKLIGEWRKNYYLVSFHLKAGIRNELLALLSGIPNRIGFPLRGSLQFINYKIPKPADLHHLKNNNYLLSVFNKDIPEYEPKLYSSAEEEKRINSLLDQFELSEGNYAVVHPFGFSMKKKNWSADYYDKMISYITKELNLPVVIIGLKNEEESIRSALKNTENIIFYMEDDILRKSELIKRARFFLGNDSGPFHIAECWQVPSVALYKMNENNFKKWHPLNSETTFTVFTSEINSETKINEVKEFLNKCD